MEERRTREKFKIGIRALNLMISAGECHRGAFTDISVAAASSTHEYIPNTSQMWCWLIRRLVHRYRVQKYRCVPRIRITTAMQVTIIAVARGRRTRDLSINTPAATKASNNAPLYQAKNVLSNDRRSRQVLSSFGMINRQLANQNFLFSRSSWLVIDS